MPALTVYRHGVTGGIPPTRNDHERAPRGECLGWTRRTSRGNLKFLYSVDDRKLDGHGIAVTLTVKHCPETPDHWSRLRKVYIDRLRRMGMVRVHWVTEWQRRKVPHLHAAIWFADPVSPAALYLAWLNVAAPYQPKTDGQFAAPIHEAMGWFKYVAKHAARGCSHYQRSYAAVPPAWQSRTGRVWGKSGDWPVTAPARLVLDYPGYHRLRRVLRAAEVSKARASGRPRWIRAARRCLARPDRIAASVLGVSSWLSVADTQRVLGALVEQGCALEIKPPEGVAHEPNVIHTCDTQTGSGP